jgi:hypothetical protein
MSGASKRLRARRMASSRGCHHADTATVRVTSLLGAKLMTLKQFRRAFALAALAVMLVPALANAADVYEGSSRVGTVNASYGGRYDISSGSSKVGYTKASYGGRWDVYEGSSKIGYTKRSYGGRWDLYSGSSKVGYIKQSAGRWEAYQSYSRVGYVKGGAGGPAAGAALLLLVG